MREAEDQRELGQRCWNQVMWGSRVRLLWLSAHACCHFSCVRLFAIPRTVAHQAPLSMGFPRQDYWSGLPFPSPGDLPNPGIEPRLLCLLRWQRGSLPLAPPGRRFAIFTSVPPQCGEREGRSPQTWRRDCSQHAGQPRNTKYSLKGLHFNQVICTGKKTTEFCFGGSMS